MVAENADFEDNFSEDIDDSRVCASCEQRHHGEYGERCDSCDEWICTNCWKGEYGEPPHIQTDEHGRREGLI